MSETIQNDYILTKHQVYRLGLGKEELIHIFRAKPAFRINGEGFYSLSKINRILSKKLGWIINPTDFSKFMKRSYSFRFTQQAEEETLRNDILAVIGSMPAVRPTILPELLTWIQIFRTLTTGKPAQYLANSVLDLRFRYDVQDMLELLIQEGWVKQVRYSNAIHFCWLIRPFDVPFNIYTLVRKFPPQLSNRYKSMIHELAKCMFSAEGQQKHTRLFYESEYRELFGGMDALFPIIKTILFHKGRYEEKADVT